MYVGGRFCVCAHACVQALCLVEGQHRSQSRRAHPRAPDEHPLGENLWVGGWEKKKREMFGLQWVLKIISMDSI